MVTAFIKFSDGRISTDASPASIEAALDDPQATFWIDLEAPSEAEQSLLADVFKFHPLAVEDTKHHVQRPKIEGYRRSAAGGAAADHFDYFYIVVHAPDRTEIQAHHCPEIDVFLCERYLISIHDPPVEAIGHVRDRTKADIRLALDTGVDMILYSILDYATDQYQPILDDLDGALDELEDQSLNNPRPDVLGRIAVKKRELMYLRRIVGPQREVIAQLTRGEVPFVRESTRVYLRDVNDHLVRVFETLELYRDLVQGARDMYLSSISNNLNQIMKTLTIFSVIALPMTVITGFFGMNFDALPGLHSPTGFWCAVVVMLGIVVGMLFFFRRRRWI